MLRFPDRPGLGFDLAEQELDSHFGIVKARAGFCL